METWKPSSINLFGQHLLQFGTVLAHADDEGQIIDRNVSIEGASGQLLRTITYDGNGTFSLSDLESAVYAQDHWILNSRVALDTGLRWETQSLTHTNRLAPRAALPGHPARIMPLSFAAVSVSFMTPCRSIPMRSAVIQSRSSRHTMVTAMLSTDPGAI